MNFLEGLKRLFIAFSLLICGGLGVIGWLDGAPPFYCSASLAIVDENSAAAIYSSMPTANLHDSLRRADASGDSAQATIISQAIRDRSDMERRKTQCPSAAMAVAKRAGFAASLSAGGAVVLFMIWLCLRWVIIGFFPTAARKT